MKKTWQKSYYVRHTFNQYAARTLGTRNEEMFRLVTAGMCKSNVCMFLVSTGSGSFVHSSTSKQVSRRLKIIGGFTAGCFLVARAVRGKNAWDTLINVFSVSLKVPVNVLTHSSTHQVPSIEPNETYMPNDCGLNHFFSIRSTCVGQFVISSIVFILSGEQANK